MADPKTTDGRADFIITYHGLVVTLEAVSDACLAWVCGNVEIEPWQWFSDRRIGIDATVAEMLRAALTEAGFTDGDTNDGC